jgi:two-component system response regulator NreC
MGPDMKRVGSNEAIVCRGGRVRRHGGRLAPSRAQPSEPQATRRVPEGRHREQAIRIVLTDAHPAVRSGLRVLLECEHDLQVVAEAADVDSARRYVRGYSPTVLVLDLDLPEESSLDAIPLIRAESPSTQIVVLSAERALAHHALRLGAHTGVSRTAAGRQLAEAVRRAAAYGGE